MLDFYKWASANFWDFFLVTFALVIGTIWVIEAIGEAFKKAKEV